MEFGGGGEGKENDKRINNIEIHYLLIGWL
jgi:hypothetical protein